MVALKTATKPHGFKKTPDIQSSSSSSCTSKREMTEDLLLQKYQGLKVKKKFSDQETKKKNYQVDRYLCILQYFSFTVPFITMHGGFLCATY